MKLFCFFIFPVIWPGILLQVTPHHSSISRKPLTMDLILIESDRKAHNWESPQWLHITVYMNNKRHKKNKTLMNPHCYCSDKLINPVKYKARRNNWMEVKMTDLFLVENNYPSPARHNMWDVCRRFINIWLNAAVCCVVAADRGCGLRALARLSSGGFCLGTEDVKEAVAVVRALLLFMLAYQKSFLLQTFF